MPASPRQRTANPLTVSILIAILTFVILELSGKGMVDDNRQVSARTSVAVLAVLKEGRVWVSVVLGILVYLWAVQLQNRRPVMDEPEFLKWSAGLPQWRPQHPAGETAVFLVPQSASRPRAVPAAVAKAAPPDVSLEEPAPVATKPVPVLRLAPLHEMAGRFALARSAGQPALLPAPAALVPLPPVPGAGALAKPGRLDIPPPLDLPALAKLPRDEFEKIAGELYRRMGYDVAALGGGEEAGVDLIMTGRNEVLIAKCWLQPGPVPVESVRELLALVLQEGATRGVLLTPGEFSRKALKFASSRGRHRLQLVSGRQFQSLMAASAAGAAPACPCCGGRTLMVEKRKQFGRSQKYWQCARAPECDGTIRAGRARTELTPAAMLPAA